ncbi:MAG: PAS domain-containing protein [Leptospira sp.]|nr:PAS domain-containing protein [Leptospira sp.]
MYFNWYCIPLLLSSISNLVLAILVFKKKNFNGYRYFFIALIITSWYSFFYAMEISTTELSQAMLFYKIEFLGSPFLSLFFFLFTLSYTGWINKVRPFLFLLLASIPSVSLVLNLTNEWHGIYYLNPKIDYTGIYPFFSIQPNQWYFVQQAYEVILMILSFILLFRMWMNTKGTFRIQLSVLLLGLLFAFSSFMITPLGIIPYGLDGVPYGLGINMILSYLGLNYLGLFDLVPQARALLLDQMKEGIIVIDKQDRIIDYNHSVVDLLSEVENSIGKKLDNILGPGKNNLQEIIQSGKDSILELEKSNTGETIWLSISTKGFTNNKNKIEQGKIITFRDISELKKVEEKIKEQNFELLKLNIEKDKFFSILAHDLRSPLNGILGLTQIISNEIEELEPHQIKDMVGGMRKASLHLYELLENLLEWGNLQNNSVIFEPEELDIKEIIEEAVYTLTLMISNKSINIKYNIEKELNVFADQKMIASVFRNLISNAVKFSHRGSEVIISAIRKNDFVEISIQDFGIGIPPNYIDKLFLNYEKTSQLGTEGEPSTGIGLIIIKEFIDRHKGKLLCESKVGEGSLFTVILPIH